MAIPCGSGIYVFSVNGSIVVITITTSNTVFVSKLHKLERWPTKTINISDNWPNGFKGEY